MGLPDLVILTEAVVYEATRFSQEPLFVWALYEHQTRWSGTARLTGTQFGDGLSSALQKIKDHLFRRALGHFADLEGTIIVKSLASQDYSARDKEIRILNAGVVEQRVLRPLPR